MLQVHIRPYHAEKSEGYVSSRNVALPSKLQALLQITFPNKNLGELLEHTIIDLLIGNLQNEVHISDNLSFVLEKLNRHFNELQKQYDITGLNIFLGIFDRSELHFSFVGNYSVLLLKKSTVVDISEGMSSGKAEFSYVSSGVLQAGNTLYVSTAPLLDHLTPDDLFLVEESFANHKEESAKDLIEREIPGNAFDIVTVAESIAKKEP